MRIVTTYLPYGCFLLFIIHYFLVAEGRPTETSFFVGKVVGQMQETQFCGSVTMITTELTLQNKYQVCIQLTA